VQTFKNELFSAYLYFNVWNAFIAIGNVANGRK